MTKLEGTVSKWCDLIGWKFRDEWPLYIVPQVPTGRLASECFSGGCLRDSDE